MEPQGVDYSVIKEKSVHGRYVINHDILKFLEKLPKAFLVKEEGKSVLGAPINSVTIGKGDRKVLMWSQMHGNEATTTKAVLDMLNFVQGTSPVGKNILDQCTLMIIPMLNPDGAAAYTRVNANAVDLNRDAQHRTQPESNLLRKVFDTFRPHYCFNLHDQRTIFNTGDSPNPATVSFLAPAYNKERSVSATRGQSMQLIVAMNQVLQKRISGQVGRYDDAFNSNCVGDTFQMLNTPTILFEAGHFPSDYEREQTREYIFTALITALEVIATDQVASYKLETYFNIPENSKQFFDILIHNAEALNMDYSKGSSIGILYKEVLRNSDIILDPKIEKIGNLTDFYGHKTYNCLNNNELDELLANSALKKLLMQTG
ncbi:M14 metallopeptidase family protein [Spongiimicrobium sp. 3-5]|uniref:M14 family metallopeptidase n=1 Tax=Spongiimicrobium sp. 3-5 TaxID=3332596 RepID=UPI00397FC16F